MKRALKNLILSSLTFVILFSSVIAQGSFDPRTGTVTPGNTSATAANNPNAIVASELVGTVPLAADARVTSIFIAGGILDSGAQTNDIIHFASDGNTIIRTVIHPETGVTTVTDAYRVNPDGTQGERIFSNVQGTDMTTFDPTLCEGGCIATSPGVGYAAYGANASNPAALVAQISTAAGREQTPTQATAAMAQQQKQLELERSIQSVQNATGSSQDDRYNAIQALRNNFNGSINLNCTGGSNAGNGTPCTAAELQARLALDRVVTQNPPLQTSLSQYVAGTANPVVVSPTTGVSGQSLNAQAKTSPVPQTKDTCNSFLNFSVITCIAKGVATFSNYVILRAVSWILYVAGVMFNQVISITIVNITANLTKLTSIVTGWSLIRDFANIGFIFIMLIISIGTIIGASSFNSKTLLVKLVVAALLINFSLFFTRALIDFSNIVTLQFYNQIRIGNGAADGGLSDAFLGPLKLTSIYGKAAASQGKTISASGGNPTLIGNITDNLGTDDYWRITLISLAGSVFLLITAIAFLAATLILILRFVTLILLLIASPLPFIASVLPSTQSYAKQWWDRLTKELLAAPVFIIMMYLTLSFVRGPGFTAIVDNAGGTNLDFNNLVPATGATTNSLAIIINFVIVIGLVYFSIAASQMVGGEGAQVAGKLFGNVTGRLRNAAKNTGGAIGRNTVGRGAEWAGKKYDNAAARFAQTGAGKFFTKNKFGKFIAGVSGVDSLLENTREGLKTAETSKYGGSLSLGERQKKDKDRLVELGNVREKSERDEKIKAGEAAIEQFRQIRAQKIAVGGTFELNDLLDTKKSGLTANQGSVLLSAISNAEKALNQLSAEEIEKKGADFVNKYAEQFTPEKFGKVLESKSFSDQEKNRFKNSRTTHVTQALTELRKKFQLGATGQLELISGKTVSPDDIKAITNIDPKDLKHLSAESFDTGSTDQETALRSKLLLAFTNSKQQEEIEKGDSFLRSTKANIGGLRSQALQLAATGNQEVLLSSLLGQYDGKALSKIAGSSTGAAFLQNTDVIDKLTRSQLKDMTAIAEPIRRSIGAHISQKQDHNAYGFIMGSNEARQTFGLLPIQQGQNNPQQARGNQQPPAAQNPQQQLQAQARAALAAYGRANRGPYVPPVVTPQPTRAPIVPTTPLPPPSTP